MVGDREGSEGRADVKQTSQVSGLDALENRCHF